MNKLSATNYVYLPNTFGCRSANEIDMIKLHSADTVYNYISGISSSLAIYSFEYLMMKNPR